MATQSRIGGLQSGTPSAVAPNLKGPCTGGYIVFPLEQKINGAAGIATVDGGIAPFDMRIICIAINHIGNGDSTTTLQSRSGANPLHVSVHNVASPAFWGVTNEQTALGNSSALAAAWGPGSGTVETRIESITARNISRGGAFDLREQSVGASSYAYTEHLFCSARGHRYDPDNVSSDFPYSAAND